MAATAHPVVLGSGSKLFPDGAQRTPLTLAGQEAFDNGVLHLTYTPPLGPRRAVA